jgi:hypothetical protein
LMWTRRLRRRQVKSPSFMLLTETAFELLIEICVSFWWSKKKWVEDVIINGRRACAMKNTYEREREEDQHALKYENYSWLGITKVSFLLKNRSKSLHWVVEQIQILLLAQFITPSLLTTHQSSNWEKSGLGCPWFWPW